ncbi:Uma2 family endonuclease [soil metagenome]
MNITVEQTMEMPDVVLFARKLDVALKAEQKKRDHFYKTVDENRKMEFINGEIFFQSPVKKHHNSAMLAIAKLLDTFVNKHRLGYVGVEKILVSLTRNDYEPDICFFGTEKANDFESRQMQFPAPDFVVEILSTSTERHDRETKFQDYAAHGVSEYWIVDAESEKVEQYLLHHDYYKLEGKSGDGVIKSVAVKGFQIPIRAIFDVAENLSALTRIISD